MSESAAPPPRDPGVLASCTDADWERVRAIAERTVAAESEEALLARILNALAFLVNATMRAMVSEGRGVGPGVAERRLYYVAMTRARRSLTLLAMEGRHPFIGDLDGPAVAHRAP
ncbi:MAG: hypothetical protein OXU81_02940, partial [Gammaproteobacteria bacterium]|nr:hypothetical protein [Gammaproteobacteria bacterium]